MELRSGFAKFLIITENPVVIPSASILALVAPNGEKSNDTPYAPIAPQSARWRRRHIGFRYCGPHAPKAPSPISFLFWRTI
jgi:hypothetical protein